MEKIQTLIDIFPSWFFPVMLILGVWEGVWKLIAMWKAGKNNHLAWFICIALINTVGILPIIYIIIQSRKTKG
jgi:hypothetical protein